MKLNLPRLVAVGICGGALAGLGCLQTDFIEMPTKPSQLPADIFKVHVHIQADPLTVDVPTLSGSSKLTLPRQKVDVQMDFETLIKSYEGSPAAHATVAERNDYGAALVFAGRFADAIKILLQLEHDQPGRYATASNLGTAYELNGDVDDAMIWIGKGMERNHDSHEGTEWLHLAILRAKKAIEADPKWLERHSVLDDDSARDRQEKERALEYQLNERLYFIQHDDPIMCDLFFQAAALTTDPDKQAYFIRQIPRFGNIREDQLRRLRRV